MPSVIRNTDMYLETGYLLRKITMPIIMLAIREPCGGDNVEQTIIVEHVCQ